MRARELALGADLVHRNQLILLSIDRHVLTGKGATLDIEEREVLEKRKLSLTAGAVVDACFAGLAVWVARRADTVGFVSQNSDSGRALVPTGVVEKRKERQFGLAGQTVVQRADTSLAVLVTRQTNIVCVVERHSCAFVALHLALVHVEEL